MMLLIVAGLFGWIVNTGYATTESRPETILNSAQDFALFERAFIEAWERQRSHEDCAEALGGVANASAPTITERSFQGRFGRLSQIKPLRISSRSALDSTEYRAVFSVETDRGMAFEFEMQGQPFSSDPHNRHKIVANTARPRNLQAFKDLAEVRSPNTEWLTEASANVPTSSSPFEFTPRASSPFDFVDSARILRSILQVRGQAWVLAYLATCKYFSGWNSNLGALSLVGARLLSDRGSAPAIELIYHAKVLDDPDYRLEVSVTYGASGFELEKLTPVKWESR